MSFRYPKIIIFFLKQKDYLNGIRSAQPNNIKKGLIYDNPLKHASFDFLLLKKNL